MTEGDVWKNYQKRNLRDIETLIPPDQQDALMPMLLGRPLLVVEPTEDSKPDEPVTPTEDVDQDASSLLEWRDEPLDQAIEYLKPFANRSAA